MFIAKFNIINIILLFSRGIHYFVRTNRHLQLLLPEVVVIRSAIFLYENEWSLKSNSDLSENFCFIKKTILKHFIPPLTIHFQYTINQIQIQIQIEIRWNKSNQVNIHFILAFPFFVLYLSSSHIIIFMSRQRSPFNILQ